MPIFYYILFLNLFLQLKSTDINKKIAIVWSDIDLNELIYVPSLKEFLMAQSKEGLIDNKLLVKKDDKFSYDIIEQWNKICTRESSNYNFLELFKSGLNRNPHELEYSGLIVLDCKYDCELGGYLSDAYSLVETIGYCYLYDLRKTKKDAPVQITPSIYAYINPLNLFFRRHNIGCFAVVTSSQYNKYYSYKPLLKSMRVQNCYNETSVNFTSIDSNDINLVTKSIKHQVNNVLNNGIRVIFLISSDLDIFRFMAAATVLGKNNGDFMFLAFEYRYSYENSTNNIYNLNAKSLDSIQKYLITINLNYLEDNFVFYDCTSCDIKNALNRVSSPNLKPHKVNKHNYAPLHYALKLNFNRIIKKHYNDIKTYSEFETSEKYNMSISTTVNFMLNRGLSEIPIFSYHCGTKKINMSTETESMLASYWPNFPPKDQSLCGYMKRNCTYLIPTFAVIILPTIFGAFILIGFIVLLILYLKYKLLVLAIQNFIISPKDLQFRKKLSRNSEMSFSVKDPNPKFQNELPLHLDISQTSDLKALGEKVSPSPSSDDESRLSVSELNDSSTLLVNSESTGQLKSASDNSNIHNNMRRRRRQLEKRVDEEGEYEDFLRSVASEEVHYQLYATNLNNMNIRNFPRQQCLRRYKETTESSFHNFNVDSVKYKLFNLASKVSDLFSYIKLNVNQNNFLNTKLYENTKHLNIGIKDLKFKNKFETTYQDRIVFVKTASCTKFKIHFLNTGLLQEIVVMRDLNHENIVSFIGICFSLNLIVTTFAKRGSLFDLLKNKNHARVFNLPLLTQMLIDVAKGMDYLHNSQLGSHGALTSKSCLIDGRWRCKVTDYGLGTYRMCDKQKTKKMRPDTEEMAKLLYMAPELLRTPRNMRPIYGTRTADIYSFSIIIQEVLLMDIPYANELLKENMTYNNILIKVRLGKKKKVPTATLR